MGSELFHVHLKAVPASKPFAVSRDWLPGSLSRASKAPDGKPSDIHGYWQDMFTAKEKCFITIDQAMKGGFVAEMHSLLTSTTTQIIDYPVERFSTSWVQLWVFIFFFLSFFFFFWSVIASSLENWSLCVFYSVMVILTIFHCPFYSNHQFKPIIAFWQRLIQSSIRLSCVDQKQISCQAFPRKDGFTLKQQGIAVVGLRPCWAMSKFTHAREEAHFHGGQRKLGGYSKQSP